MTNFHHPHLIFRVTEKLSTRFNEIIKSDDEGKKKLTLKVVHDREDFYTLEINDEEYPAMIGHCPTPIEAYKTFDSKIVLKGGDIGQILYVFENESDRNAMKSKIAALDNNISYLPHGLTIPTRNIVEKRYKKTRKGKKPSVIQIAEVMERIDKREGMTEDKKYVEEFEEVVDCEDWMIDPITGQGRVFEFMNDDITKEENMKILLEHPNLLLSQLDLEEELEQEEEERLREKNRQTNMEQDQSQSGKPKPSTEYEVYERPSGKDAIGKKGKDNPLETKDGNDDDSESDSDFDFDAAINQASETANEPMDIDDNKQEDNQNVQTNNTDSNTQINNDKEEKPNMEDDFENNSMVDDDNKSASSSENDEWLKDDEDEDEHDDN